MLGATASVEKKSVAGKKKEIKTKQNVSEKDVRDRWFAGVENE